jgi:ABC-type nickel/cobalt efflux system permease component RcnA
MLATSGWRANLAIVLSMGMRPCTGAILVLVLAFALDLLWVGVAAVLAMSLGTGIALVTMGVLVIKARQWAIARLGAREGQAHLVVDGLAFAGGCAVLLLGVSLLAASFGPAHPLGL